MLLESGRVSAQFRLIPVGRQAASDQVRRFPHEEPRASRVDSSHKDFIAELWDPELLYLSGLA